MGRPQKAEPEAREGRIFPLPSFPMESTGARVAARVGCAGHFLLFRSGGVHQFLPRTGLNVNASFFWSLDALPLLV